MMLTREIVGTHTQYACAGERFGRKRKYLIRLANVLNQFVQGVCLFLLIVYKLRTAAAHYAVVSPAITLHLSTMLKMPSVSFTSLSFLLIPQIFLIINRLLSYSHGRL